MPLVLIQAKKTPHFAVTMSGNIADQVLADLFEAEYGHSPMAVGKSIIATFTSSANIHSSAKDIHALDTGLWPIGSVLKFINNGAVHGRAGAGGLGGYARCSPLTATAGEPGDNGGVGIFVQTPIEITNNGTIVGGSGGGGGGGGMASEYTTTLALGGAGGGGGAYLNASSGGLGGPISPDPVSCSSTLGHAGEVGHSSIVSVGGAGGRASSTIITSQFWDGYEGIGGTSGSPTGKNATQVPVESGGGGGGSGGAGGGGGYMATKGGNGAFGDNVPWSTIIVSGAGGAGGSPGKAIGYNGNAVTLIDNGTIYGVTS